MPTPVRSSRFKRDVKRVEKRGEDMRKLRTVLLLLIEGTPLPADYGITRSGAPGAGIGICTLHPIGC